MGRKYCCCIGNIECHYCFDLIFISNPVQSVEIIERCQKLNVSERDQSKFNNLVGKSR